MYVLCAHCASQLTVADSVWLQRLASVRPRIYVLHPADPLLQVLDIWRSMAG